MRMLLRIQPYSYDIWYKPDKEVCIADALSRMPVQGQEIQDVNVTIHVMRNVSWDRLEAIKSATTMDSELRLLKEMVHEGWPEVQKECPVTLRPYWNFRDELAIVDEHGVPNTLISGNGPQFISQEFCDFARQFEFQHQTSSPRYPQSDGKAERFIGTVDQTLTKAAESNEDPTMALLCLKKTPIEAGKTLPSELFYGRKMKSNLPICSEPVTRRE
ncbi:uncharacterized protein [Palaemon carinicauda]|uniref:uncharacterized protein n=1 Tax=Palaemon carinicauda TaxID=392227 RepID=UPI0035B638A9